MKASEEIMYFRCLAIETIVKTMVLKGIMDNEKLVETINNQFSPSSSEEMERYSEAILYAKFSVLN